MSKKIKLLLYKVFDAKMINVLIMKILNLETPEIPLLVAAYFLPCQYAAMKGKESLSDQ